MYNIRKLHDILQQKVTDGLPFSATLHDYYNMKSVGVCSQVFITITNLLVKYYSFMSNSLSILFKTLHLTLHQIIKKIFPLFDMIISIETTIKEGNNIKTNNTVFVFVPFFASNVML